MDKDRIALVFGGRSSEHDVSLMSCASVIRAIDKTKHELIYIGITREGAWKILEDNGDVPGMLEDGTWIEHAKDFNLSKLREAADFALPIIHGPYCEDGRLQGFFETIDIPYGGCGVLASAAAMDKLVAKELFLRAGFPVCRHVAVFRAGFEEKREAIADEVEEKLGYPCFVKPANMGSSVGITKAHTREEFFEACEEAFKYDKRLIVEEAVNARELETGLLGNEYPEAAQVGEIIPSEEFYDYEDKYINGTSALRIPADIPEETRDRIRDIAVKAFRAIDGEGFARADFFMDKDTGEIYINEINTLPGFTKISMFPRLWEAWGVSYAETIERIIELGYERYNAKNNR